jgi:hypothetical protein
MVTEWEGVMVRALEPWMARSPFSLFYLTRHGARLCQMPSSRSQLYTEELWLESGSRGDS